jgi:hypothetical protein
MHFVMEVGGVLVKYHRAQICVVTHNNGPRIFAEIACYTIWCFGCDKFSHIYMDVSPRKVSYMF